MADPIQFELVSPEEKLISEPIAHVVLPGSEGELGVSAEHTSLVVSLQPGVVKLYRDGLNGEAEHIFIAGGFADISADNCTVLAEEAIAVGDLNKGELEQQLRNLNEDYGLAVEWADKARVEVRIKLVRAKLEAAA